MEGQLIVRGNVLAQKQSTFEGKTSHSIQLMKRNAKGAVELMNVKLPDGADPAKYREGSPVEMLVDVSTYEGNLYFKGIGDAVASKAEARPVTAKN